MDASRCRLPFVYSDVILWSNGILIALMAQRHFMITKNGQMDSTNLWANAVDWQCTNLALGSLFCWRISPCFFFWPRLHQDEPGNSQQVYRLCQVWVSLGWKVFGKAISLILRLLGNDTVNRRARIVWRKGPCCSFRTICNRPISRPFCKLFSFLRMFAELM